MSKQYNKEIKRKRRAAYIKRRNTAARAATAAAKAAKPAKKAKS